MKYTQHQTSKQPGLKMGRKLNIFPKRKCKWPTGIWKDAWYQANIRELQIKATARYHVTSVRVVILKRTTNKKCWWGCRGKRTLIYCWYECKLVQPLWKIVWSFLKKLIKQLPCNPAISCLDIYSKEISIVIKQDICNLVFFNIIYSFEI